MALCKLQTREQRITDLISCFSIAKTSPLRTVYLIDRSFHHPEIERMSTAEKGVFSRTIDNFVRREEMGLEKQQEQKEKLAAESCHRHLMQSVRKFQQSKSAHFFNPHSQKVKQIDLSIPDKHVFIERKYNHQIAYQLHTFLQAKRIENDRARQRQQACPQPSPLLQETLKKVRATVGCEKDVHFPANGPSIHQEYVDEKIAIALKNTKGSKQKQGVKRGLKGRQSSCCLGIFQKQQHRYLKRSLKMR